MMHRQLLYTTIDEPIGLRTVLGWTLQGRVKNLTGSGTTCHVGGVITNELLHNLIKESFKLEDYVAKDGAEKQPSVEDKRALSIMESTSKQREDGRWEIGHLWRNAEAFPTDGYDEALSRLLKTEMRMKKNSSFAEVYVKKFEEYTEKGYIRKLTQSEILKVTGKTRYVSHFGVVNPNKPGKFRLVFDAAEKAGGVSLNDYLLTGPDLIRPLQAILFNFRLHKVVICGDIEDMFHRIYIRDEDQTAQRFLWRGGNSREDPDVYIMKVMIFGATSSPSCAIYIKNRNAELFQEVYPAAVKSLKNDTYCDDTLTGTQSVSEAIELRQQITEICEYGGFTMKKWISNSNEVMETIPAELRLDGKKMLTEAAAGTERVLGLWWDPDADEFTFQVKFNKVNPEVLNGKVPTKREACSLVMSLYDPLGFIGNYKIKGMIILQQTWRSGVDWDDTMPEEVYQYWKAWLEDLPNIEEIKIPRCYSENLNEASIQLHTFVDASAEAIAAVSFIRIESSEGIEVSFVGSSVKVAPLKKRTIPRLELEAALLGVKVAKKILRDLNMKIESCVYWSDSSTVLSWIKSEAARFKEYVANRVGRIQEETNASEWRWIPTKENVADDATRLGTKPELSSNSRWLRGPAFLWESPDDWPKRKEPDDEQSTIAAFAGEVAVEMKNEDMTTVPAVERFSSFHRLVRATAAVKVLAMYWLSRTREKDTKRKQEIVASWNAEKLNAYMTPETYMEAEKKLIRVVQSNLDLKKYRKITPVLDQDGIVRAHGRLEHATCVDESTRHPILLPAKHHVVDLITDQAHRAYGHYGRNTVYNSLREKYFIEDGRQAVRSSFSRCWFCKMKKACPVYPEMASLPSFRLEANCQPFCYTGVDLFGPIEVTVGRRHEKRWGVIFTDLVTRGTHLDVVHGLSADEMLLTFSRFVDTRGVPLHVYSDNATNFHAVDKELRKREKYHDLKWHFIPAASPHMGGAWESMVKQTKKVLYNLLNGKYPKDQVLITLLKTVECIINSRPLSYVSGDLDDEPALTPNHFLRGIGFGSRTGSGPTTSSSFLGEELGDEVWGQQWERAQIMAKKFWERWTKEVLPDLLKRNKWTTKREPVQVGDIIIMVDELKPRNAWSKAVVSKVFPGKDGVVRVVEVTTRDFKSKTTSSYRRAVAKICPTGLRCDLTTT